VAGWIGLSASLWVSSIIVTILRILAVVII
jgi:hypothetical protein